jgi:hypothetical protein
LAVVVSPVANPAALFGSGEYLILALKEALKIYFMKRNYFFVLIASSMILMSMVSCKKETRYE